jgi:hypothetical protein
MTHAEVVIHTKEVEEDETVHRQQEVQLNEQIYCSDQPEWAGCRQVEKKRRKTLSHTQI